MTWTKWGTSLPALVVRGLPKKASVHSLAGPAVKAAAVMPTAIVRHRAVQAAAGAAATVEHSPALQQRCQVVAQLLHVNNRPAGPIARRWQAACSVILALGHGLAVQGEASGGLHSHTGVEGSHKMSSRPGSWLSDVKLLGACTGTADIYPVQGTSCFAQAGNARHAALHTCDTGNMKLGLGACIGKGSKLLAPRKLPVQHSSLTIWATFWPGQPC